LRAEAGRGEEDILAVELGREGKCLVGRGRVDTSWIGLARVGKDLIKTPPDMPEEMEYRPVLGLKSGSISLGGSQRRAGWLRSVLISSIRLVGELGVAGAV